MFQKIIGVCDVVCRRIFLTNGGCCLVTLVSFLRKNIVYVPLAFAFDQFDYRTDTNCALLRSYPFGIIWQHVGGTSLGRLCRTKLWKYMKILWETEAMRKVSCRSPLLRWSRCQGDSLTHWRLASALEMKEICEDQLSRCVGCLMSCKWWQVINDKWTSGGQIEK